MAERKIWVQTLQARHRVSICLGCEVSGISRSAYYDKPKQIDETVITDLRHWRKNIKDGAFQSSSSESVHWVTHGITSVYIASIRL